MKVHHTQHEQVRQVSEEEVVLEDVFYYYYINDWCFIYSSRFGEFLKKSKENNPEEAELIEFENVMQRNLLEFIFNG